MVKFGHIADVHLGGWKQQPMRDLNFESFKKSLDICIAEKIEFLLVVGDLFDTAYPPIEILKETFSEFKRLKEAGILCFIISGSHDYSVSGKTFLEVLEKAGFCKDVSNFEENGDEILLKPTIHGEVVIYGFPGKKSGLDVKDLKKIKLQESPGYKILMLHTTLDKAVGDLPIDSVEADSLPQTDYCALGHIHIRLQYKNFVYPGPIFPNNFSELENLKHGSFCIVDTQNETPMKRIELPLKEVELVNVEVNDGLTATEKIISDLRIRNIRDKIVLLRVKGELRNSKQSDIKFPKIEEFAKENGAYFLLRNTHELKTKELEFDSEIEDSENLEEEIIKIYSEKNPSDFDKLIPQLMTAFSIQKEEGETTENFINRLFGESRKIMDI